MLLFFIRNFYKDFIMEPIAKKNSLFNRIAVALDPDGKTPSNAHKK